MAYTPTEWHDGDVITAEKLNKLEKAVQNEQVGPKGEPGTPGQKGEPGQKGDPGAAGKGVKSIALTTDSSGKVTGGTVTFTDSSSAPITVTTAGG